MAIFRKFDVSSRDRSSEDRRRHKELVEKSIRENIGNIISEESIIENSKNKVVKIPIKGIKEYYFKYGKSQEGVASGSGKEEKGKRITKSDPESSDAGAGTEEGEEIYETEISIDEAIDTLFDGLDLPNLRQKKFKELEIEGGIKKWGVKNAGIPPRLAKKQTMSKKIKRKQRLKGTNKRVPFHRSDLKYYSSKPKKKRESNAVIICIMDTSGSMGHSKKYLARSFYFLLYHFVKIKYVKVEIVFVAHTTVAKEVSEDDFFHRGESGGTYISSGYQKALDIIEDRYNDSLWNVYAFHCSDGDNWGEDNETATTLAKQLCSKCNLFGYGEIKTSSYSSTIMNKYLDEVKCNNFVAIKITKREDVWTSFKKMLQVETNAEKEGESWTTN